MNFINFDYLVRNFEAGELLEKFLVSAVSSILIIRVFLALTDYPMIGGENFHISHMLFGGLLMTLALFSLLIFLNSKIKSLGAILGGVGFGTFIDELGKFITLDNDYFFKPTIALIYVIFILIYFLYRIFNYPTKVSKKEYAVNAFELLREVVLNDFELHEKNKALEFLNKSDKKDPITKSFFNIVNNSKYIIKDKNIIFQIRDKITYYYSKFIKLKLFVVFIVCFFSFISAFQIFSAISNIMKAQSFFTYGLLISSFSSLFLVFLANYFLVKKKRLFSYKLLKFSVLISIFLTQFFLFFQEQLSAFAQMLMSLVALSVIHNLILQEQIIKIKA